MQCWEYMKCGREVGGARVAELGLCPASRLEAGDACWFVAGTFCDGEIQGCNAQRFVSCMDCEFYQHHDAEHRARVRAKYAHRLAQPGRSQGRSSL